MTSNKTVFFIVGILLVILGIFMMIPYAVQLIYEENSNSFFSSAIITVVIGILTGSGNIDTIITKKLGSQAFPMAVTFHKAIDQTQDILYELDQLSKIQEISSILTSGGKKTAIKGQNMLRKIIDQYGKRFTIIAAGSVTHKNFDEIHGLINAQEYHGKNLIA